MKTIFFDLDGTLTDPKIGITASIRYAMDRLGEDVPAADDLTWCIGPPLLESFRTLVGRDRSVQALALYRERFSEVGLYENERYPGITQTLSSLSRNNVQLCVASSKPRVFVEKILDHFELTDYFARIFGAELDGTRGDKSDLLRFALAESRSDASTSTMVGDRKYDIIGASDNGIPAIGVLYGYGSKQELTRAGALCLAETPQHLVPLLQ